MGRPSGQALNIRIPSTGRWLGFGERGTWKWARLGVTGQERSITVEVATMNEARSAPLKPPGARSNTSGATRTGRETLGATRRTVLAQFMLEATMLCVIGGVVGVAVGTTAATILGRINGWPMTVTPQSIVLEVGFSAAIGVFLVCGRLGVRRG